MRVVPFATEPEQRAALDPVARHLRAGGLIVYPTETVFGMGSTVDPAAVARLRSLKQRDEVKPFLLLVSDESQAPGLEWNATARRLAQAFWPGPLTLVLNDAEGRYPEGVASAAGGVALRRTSHAGVRTLLDALGAPITSTSANPPGAPPARTSAEARSALDVLAGEAGAEVWLLDGPAGGAAPSTVVDCTGPRARLVRAGAVPVEKLREVVDVVEG